ncbi:hypothetical protein O4H66_14350 [Comamonadaceae bacterium G21597-S1]|nr:hypothetical protein [Comamonadaceae bacterium G21597-S1]
MATSRNCLFRHACIAFVMVLTQGCASIVNDTTNPMRVETYSQAGTEVADMQCKLENDYGSQTVKTPGTLQIRRSAKDLHIICSKIGEPDAKGVVTSRANGGMFGNIIFGGGIGAIIDHNKGTAYSYPQWVRLVVGRMLGFDRSNDKDGMPNLGKDVLPTPPRS